MRRFRLSFNWLVLKGFFLDKVEPFLRYLVILVLVFIVLVFLFFAYGNRYLQERGLRLKWPGEVFSQSPQSVIFRINGFLCQNKFYSQTAAELESLLCRQQPPYPYVKYRPFFPSVLDMQNYFKITERTVNHKDSLIIEFTAHQSCHANFMYFYSPNFMKPLWDFVSIKS